MNHKNRALIALGTNQPFNALAGEALLRAALAALESNAIAIERISAFWTTPAWPDPSDPAFTNAVAIISAPKEPAEALLGRLLAVEAAFGRVRGARNGPRTLDLDLLDLDGQILRSPQLTLPHPRLAGRVFVLGPLAEVAPDWRHPQTGESVHMLLAAAEAESGAAAQ